MELWRAMTPYGEQLRAALNSAAANPASTALVIVNYGSSQLIAQNVPTGLESEGVQVVVVDNFSSSPERDAITNLAAARGWELVAQENLGFGEGINAGVLRGAELGARSFVTLNPDAAATVQVIGALADALEEQPRTLLSPLVVASDGRPFFRGSTINLRTGRIRTGWVDGDGDPDWKNWISGACVAFTGATFAELDGYAAGYFLYWEDLDLSRRAANRGITLRLRLDLKVVHDEGGTHTAAASSGKSPLYYYYNTRNRLLFASRLVGPQERRAWLLNTPKESYRIWRRGGRRQALTEPKGVLAAIRGTIAGLRLMRQQAH